MKDEFPAFYYPIQQEFDDLWAKCTFVLDANVLLNLYRYSSEACQELINTLKILSTSNRLWIPHQVALEYHKNRLGVIINEKSKYKALSKIIDKHMKDLKDDLTKDDRDRKNTHVATIVFSLEKVIDKSSKKIRDELKRHTDTQPDRIVRDEIRETLGDLLKGKIGTPYDQAKLEDIYKKCDKRYELRIPPGYEDGPSKKGREKYGDAILWLQILDYAKEKKVPVIFVTDDDKEDWWNGEKEVKDKQPNYDLLQEFISITGRSFHMYPTDRFLYWATKKLDAKVSPKTIEEIKQTNPEVKRETRTYVPNFVSSAGYAGFPTTLASSIGYAGFPTTFAPSLGYAEFPTTFSLYPPGLVATSTRSLIREKDWGDFIRIMSPFEREYLVKILDEVMINPPLLISPSLDPIGFSVSEELNGDYSILFHSSRIIISKEDLRSFRDYVASHILF